MTRGAMCPSKRRPALGRSPAWSYVSRRYQTAATIHVAHQTPSQRAFMFLSQKVTVRFRRATKWCTISIYIKWKSTWKWYSAHKMRESIIRKYVFIKGHGAREGGRVWAKTFMRPSKKGCLFKSLFSETVGGWHVVPSCLFTLSHFVCHDKVAKKIISTLN